MNYKMVAKYLGSLVLAEAAFLLPSALVAVFYAEPTAARALFIVCGLCLGLGLCLFLPTRRAESTIYAREGFVVAGGGWLLVSLLGALPFTISGEIPHYADAFFEAASGFTTTGASILTDVEALSHGMLFWRSFTHWMGGIGVLAFILAIVRGKAGAGFTLHLLRAETPGPQKGKMLPQTRQSIRGLFVVYGVLSALNLAFLLFGGMPLFDALCTMFGTAGTGGFGIKNDSMASYSVYLQAVTTVFMAIFGVNFSLFFMAFRGQLGAAIRDAELRLYFGIMLGSSLAIAAVLFWGGFYAPGESLHQSAFTVSSVMTTTGFAISNFDLWPQFARTLLLVLMFCGAMAGGTGGGFKTARVLILGKIIKNGLHRLLHPRSVKAVKVNGKALPEDVVWRTMLYLAVYCALLLGVMVVVSADGLSLEANFSATVSCLNNIGPGLAEVGPVANYAGYSAFSKLVLALTMLLGRLEIFPLLLLFMPSTWHNKA